MIPPRNHRTIQRDYDKEHKARHLIENFFCKLKQYRAIATRYDKTARILAASTSPRYRRGTALVSWFRNSLNP